MVKTRNQEKLETRQQPQMSKRSIYFFIPNIIGYLRVLLLFVSLYYLPNHPYYAMSLYSASCLLDALDGVSARYFNQATKFGAVLDMVTDRSSTTCLLVHLAIQRPDLSILFQILIALDLSSHYMHMSSSLYSGSSSHKIVKAGNYLLKLYYTEKKVLFGVCAGNEVFFVITYFYFYHYSSVPYIPFPYPWFGNVGYFGYWITFPIFAFKQIVNVIQLVNASNSLVENDLNERKKSTRRSF